MATIQTQCLIIGSGPAGYTAAIYASRAGLKPLMYQGSQPGGQLMITNDVENYPGYADGIMGPEMMEDFKNQAERFGTDIRFGMVTKVDFKEGEHTVFVDDADAASIEAETIIICTGASAKWLGLEAEIRLRDATLITRFARCVTRHGASKSSHGGGNNDRDRRHPWLQSG